MNSLQKVGVILLLCILSFPTLAVEILPGGGFTPQEPIPQFRGRIWLNEKYGLDTKVPLNDSKDLRVAPLIRSKNNTVSPYLGVEVSWYQNTSPKLIVGTELTSRQKPGQRLALQLETDLKEIQGSVAFFVELGKKQAPSTSEPEPEDELLLLAKLITAEAKGEPYLGQVAVGGVVLNRVANPLFPNTIEAVIYQPGQFSPVDDGAINQEPTASCLGAAKEALGGSDPSLGALYFYNPNLASPKGKAFMATKEVTVNIGNHIFAK